MHYGHVTARAFIAGIFLVSGFGKLTGVQETAADIAALGLPLPVLAAVMAGIVELVCGACLALGLKTAWGRCGPAGVHGAGDAVVRAPVPRAGRNLRLSQEPRHHGRPVAGPPGRIGRHGRDWEEARGR